MNFIKKIFNKTFLIILTLICFLIMFLFWGWFEKQYYKAVGMYDVYRGDKAYHQGELQKAIDYYNAGLLLYPEHYGAWFNLGNIYVVYEDYYSAADAYKNAIEHNPKFTLAKMNLGIISAEKLGDFDEAITQYKSITTSKKHLWSVPFIFNNRGSERTNKGLAFYNMGVAYREKSIYNNGDKYYTTRNLQNALAAYKNAKRILKHDYDTQYNMALTYHLMGDYQNAGLSYCKAIKLDPMNYEAHYNLAILLRHLRMYKESLNELEKASILASSSDVGTNATNYVFDVLNEISKIIVDNDQYKYLVDKAEKETQESNLTNGKIVANEDLDKEIYKSLQTCESKEYFEKYK